MDGWMHSLKPASWCWDTGCRNLLVGKCPHDHEHCHFCAAAGHRALECPAQLKLDRLAVSAMRFESLRADQQLEEGVATAALEEAPKVASKGLGGRGDNGQRLGLAEMARRRGLSKAEKKAEKKAAKKAAKEAAQAARKALQLAPADHDGFVKR